jgi:hypothetical protein
VSRCEQVCYYRDKQSINKFQIATVTAKGVEISEPFALETKWDYQVCLAALSGSLHLIAEQMLSH